MKQILTGPVRVATPTLRPPQGVFRRLSVALAIDDDDDDESGSGKKKIRVKGKTISVEKHQRIVEKARSQERDKQQERIAELEKSLRIAKKKLIKSEGALEALKEAETSDGKIDVETLLDRAHKKWSKRAKELEGDDTIRNEVSELRKKVEKYESRELRRRLIAEAGGEDTMIVEMVKGNTEEEIEASIEKAQAAYQKYGGSKKKKKRSDADEEDDDVLDSDEEDEDEESDEEGDEDADENDEDDDDIESGKGKRHVPPTLRSAEGRNASERRGDKVLNGVKSLGPADYQKNRSKIMDRLRARYANGANPFSTRRPAGRRA